MSARVGEYTEGRFAALRPRIIRPMADVIMLGFIAGFLRGGWASGFLRRLFALLFMAISFVAGAFLRTPTGALVHQFLPKVPEQYAEAIGYSVAFSALLLIFNL